jgi:hypothetical protein
MRMNSNRAPIRCDAMARSDGRSAIYHWTSALMRGYRRMGYPKLPEKVLEGSLTPPHRLRYDGEEMANRPDFTPDQVLSAAQLAEVRHGFSKLSLPSLQQAYAASGSGGVGYAEAWERCKLDRRGRPPNSVHIQILVQVWKALRKSS